MTTEGTTTKLLMMTFFDLPFCLLFTLCQAARGHAHLLPKAGQGGVTDLFHGLMTTAAQ